LLQKEYAKGAISYNAVELLLEWQEQIGLLVSKAQSLTEIVAFYFYMTLRNWGQVNQMHG
jgi:hypothetical protein